MKPNPFVIHEYMAQIVRPYDPNAVNPSANTPAAVTNKYIYATAAIGAVLILLVIALLLKKHRKRKKYKYN